jgi:hypothetical protein
MAHTVFTVVSYANTPIAVLSEKAAAIAALGWQEREEGRGDPWLVWYRKDFEDSPADPEAELRQVLGPYWLGADAIARHGAIS